ncbi:MAG: na+/Pi-cotransporter family protein [Micavibrio sp.]|nr:na+/Pi-cotransporter family protein [Micavibrio sp.]
MSPTLVLINIIGGVCLLLFGLRLVRVGVTRAFGASLQRTLSRATGNRFKAFIAGIITTMVLQSSTATTMIIASFVGRGLITVAAGLAVILGADVGTTLVAQVLTIDLTWLSPILIIIGYFLHSAKTNTDRKKQAGRVFIGLGLMLLALALIKQASLPLKTSETLPLLLGPLENDVFLTLILAALLTWLFHSSLAFILLLVSLADTGVIPLEMALIMVLGANIGNVFPTILAAKAESEKAMRIPVGNLVMRVGGVVLAIPLITYFHDYMSSILTDTHWAIVHFHTIFNLCLAVVFLPFVSRVEKAAKSIIPDSNLPPSRGAPVYINETELMTPSIALVSASREALRLADMSVEMLQLCRRAFENNDHSLLSEIQDMDDDIDDLFLKLKSYMARMEANSLNEKEAKRHFEILTFAINLEHIGDIIDRNLLPVVTKKIEKQKFFSKEGFAEIRDLYDRVLKSIQLAQTVFISKDIKLARQLVEEKDYIKQAEMKTSRAHLDRLQKGVAETQDTSSMHMDMIRDLRRINSLVTSVAYPILEEKGQLTKSRLKPLRYKKEKGENNDQDIGPAEKI